MEGRERKVEFPVEQRGLVAHLIGGDAFGLERPAATGGVEPARLEPLLPLGIDLIVGAGAELDARLARETRIAHLLSEVGAAEQDLVVRGKAEPAGQAHVPLVAAIARTPVKADPGSKLDIAVRKDRE